MKITVTVHEPGDDDSVEEYDSLESLEEELQFSADDDYTSKVMGKIKAGETQFTVGNGGGAYDVYVVSG